MTAPIILKAPILLPAAALAIVAFTGCDPGRAAPRSSADAGLVLLATVNGSPITERDVEHRARGPGAAMGHGSAPPGAVLHTVVRDELLAQEAVALGLDRDPEFRARIDDLEAQVRTFRRQELGRRLRTWAQEHATVTEAEARAWFEQNTSLVRTRFHVYQLFYRGHLEALLADHADIRAGKPFEEVARRRFDSTTPAREAAWDLGELGWSQLPPAWRGIVDRLGPGEVSDVIRGEGERAWVVKLAGRRIDPAITFDSERERIVALLRQPKADALHARRLAEAEAKARIVAFAPDRPPPPTRTADARGGRDHLP